MIEFTAYPKDIAWKQIAIAEGPDYMQLFRSTGGLYRKSAKPGNVKMYTIYRITTRLAEIRAHDDAEAIKKANEWLRRDY
jgi:hypothetical protein